MTNPSIRDAFEKAAVDMLEKRVGQLFNDPDCMKTKDRIPNYIQILSSFRQSLSDAYFNDVCVLNKASWRLAEQGLDYCARIDFEPSFKAAYDTLVEKYKPK